MRRCANYFYYGLLTSMLLITSSAGADINISTATHHNAPVSKSSAIPGGGWQYCDNKDCNKKVGVAWADDYGLLIGHIADNHFPQNEVGDTVESVAWENIPKKTLSVIQKDNITSIKMIDPIDIDRVSSTIVTSDGTTYTISGWAETGELAEGQSACKNSAKGGNPSGDGGAVCGKVSLLFTDSVDNCREDGSLLASSCSMMLVGGPGEILCPQGDTGSPVWSDNHDGSVKLLGVVTGMMSGTNCSFEPIYSISQAFGGKPYIDSSPLITIKNYRVVEAWNYSLSKEEFLNRTGASSSQGDVFVDMPDEKYFELYKHPGVYDVQLKAGSSTAKVTL